MQKFDVKQQNGSPIDNGLLALLPRDLLAQLMPQLNVMSLQQGFVAMEAGDDVEHVYFPFSGMFSLLSVMQDGKTIETATIGREGAIGAMAGLKPYRTLVRVVVQLPTVTGRIASSQFRKAVSASEQLRNLCIDYNEVLLTQARITAACNALHGVEARFARWLLQSSDRAGSDTVALTQEILAEMLGVRRTSITEVAGRLQADGMITYSRGVIRIADRGALEQVACECYRNLIEHEATPT